MVRAAALLALAACGGPAVEAEEEPAVRPACSPVANVEIVPLDAWGRDLEGATLTMDASPVPVADPAAGPGVTLIRLGEEPVTLSLLLSAADHDDLTTTLRWDGSVLAVDEPGGDGRVAWSFAAARGVEEATCPVWTVYAGVAHGWFAPSGPAPTRNDVTFHMDGASFWEDVAGALATAQSRVTWATWWWESDFELVRGADHATLSEDERWENTALGRLEALDGVDRRILVNRFWAENSDFTTLLNSDSALRAYAENLGDGLEVVLQGNDTEVPLEGQYEGDAASWSFAERVEANPRYAGRDVEESDVRETVALELDVASWHQKAVTVDGAVAFVSGMNTKGADWDTSAHLVHDSRRMLFDASEAEREAVAAGEELPDFGPRKDYGLRVDGPAAHDVEAILADRWEAALASGAAYAEYATPIALEEARAEAPDGALVQVTATMPEPWALQAIRETHAKAFAQATDYIYIEDQYFRAPLMNDVIIERMLADDDLLLIVITMDVSMTDGGAKFTWLSDATFRALFPDRYLLLQLRSVDLVTDTDAWWGGVEFFVADVDTHSKLRLVDDRYLSVGSCNFNNRGYLYEGELDVAILDDATASAARADVFANLVGDDWSLLLSDDPRNNFDVLAAAAEQNQLLLEWWEDASEDLDPDEAEVEWERSRPSGFVYPLEISDQYEWDVGPDAF